MADESDFLHDYATTGSPQAFTKLVEQNINLVHAAARRQCRGCPHLADDVTQAVFLILARKARTVRSAAVLPAWLISTTRYAAANALSLEARRRRHEQKAAAMAQQIHNDAQIQDASDDALAPSLDEALAKLNENDRSAVTMRFLQGRSLREVGVAMGTNEATAQKRVIRAVEKLRGFFARRGVTMESTALASGIARQGAHIAPAALAPLVVSHAMSTTMTTTAAATIADAAARSIVAAKLKLLGVMAASIAAVAVTTGVVVTSRPTSTAASQPAANPAPLGAVPVSPLWQPVATSADVPGLSSAWFDNDLLVPTSFSDTKQYRFGIDPLVRRALGSDPAGFIMSTTPQTTAMASRGWMAIALPHRGKRVRMSAYLKTKDVERSAAIQLLVLNGAMQPLVIDVMGTPALRGTSDWVHCYSVVDVPEEATQIQFAGAIWGPGKLWMDGFQIEDVPLTVETTDDGKWQAFTPFLDRYVATLDPAVMRGGHATVCLHGAGDEKVEYGAYMRRIQIPELKFFAGRKARITAYLKSEDINGRAGLYATVSANNKVLARYGNRETPPVKGTLEWARYTAEVEVPDASDTFELGVILHGAGKVWIDELTIAPE